MEIKILNESKNELPAYSTKNSAGMDLRANLSESVILKPLERRLIKTGIFVELSVGYEAQIRPRSGLAIKEGITVLNTPGTIDSDYRGEIGIIIVNLSNKNFTINNGDRIAQMVVNKVEHIEWTISEELSSTNRGDGGFGHTGKK